MLSTMRNSWLLFALFALFALSSAISFENAFNIDGIEAYLHHGEKRQASGTGNSASEDTPSPTSNPPNTPTPTPSDDDEPSSTPPPESTPEPSSNPPVTSNPPQTSNNDDDSPSSTPRPSSTRRTTAEVITTPIVSSSVQFLTRTYTSVIGDQTFLGTEVTSSVVLNTLGTDTQTLLPGTQDRNGGGGGGLSDSNKKIIGGVVGGVGGAILLGGIALVCFRIWGKKRRVSEDDDDIMAGTGSALGDKSSNTGSSPFQSNLEQYHNPGGRPNAAANF